METYKNFHLKLKGFYHFIAAIINTIAKIYFLLSIEAKLNNFSFFQNF